MTAFLELPWASVGAFLGSCIAFLTLVSMITSRWPRVERLIGGWFQGIFGLRSFKAEILKQLCDGQKEIKAEVVALSMKVEGVELGVNRINGTVRHDSRRLDFLEGTIYGTKAEEQD